MKKTEKGQESDREGKRQKGMGGESNGGRDSDTEQEIESMIKRD